MSTKKPADDLASKAKAATAERVAAEEAAQAAQEAVSAAQADERQLKARLSNGDARVTAKDLSEAATEIERAELLAHGAVKALEHARFAETLAVAQSTAGRLSGTTGERQKIDEAVRKAADGVTKALVKLATEARRRHDAIAQAKADAIAAGLQSADPLSPVRVESRRVNVRGRGYRNEQVLVVDGDDIVDPGVLTTAREALEAALADADVKLEVRA